ncbi:unnamed protein product [Polarella glacialis]|uniref:Uncharacterized protein n=1 Tax=Polarella glacialis TaxID=89957 RepID=A0A813FBW4_POLGL|nr:unnamed protein product [Polarella glacialis]
MSKGRKTRADSQRGVKGDFSTEFAGRNIPLTKSAEEQDAKELSELSHFFSMGPLGCQTSAGTAFSRQVSEELQRSDSHQLPQPPGPGWKDGSQTARASFASSIRSGGVCEDLSPAKQRLHRPVSEWELQEARPPRSLGINDFPSIFQPQLDRPSPQETHYDYFTRRLPGEQYTEHREAMRCRTETTRKTYKYYGRRGATAYAGDTGRLSQGSGLRDMDY